MATSSFERPVKLQTNNAARRFNKILTAKNTSLKTIPAYTSAKRARSEELLKQLLSHSEK